MDGRRDGADLQLSRRSRSERTPAIDSARRRRIERRPERLVLAERLEVGIGARKRTVLRVEGNCPFEVRDGLGGLLPLRVGDR